ncbi:hypothetical protein FLAVO9R_70375 [Flavobacterium sp. 9R]|nr:hypothetical protein FLAVO9R_70375 [Flavobacterium sp. 9R]
MLAWGNPRSSRKVKRQTEWFLENALAFFKNCIEGVWVHKGSRYELKSYRVSILLELTPRLSRCLLGGTQEVLEK